MLTYPFTVEEDGGAFIAQRVDLPGALTHVFDRAQLPAMALEALTLIFEALMEEGAQIPAPSPSQAGQLPVEVPPETALKLALYQIMRAVGLSREDLARQLVRDPAHVSRLLDLFEETPLGDLSEAIHGLARALPAQAASAA